MSMEGLKFILGTISETLNAIKEDMKSCDEFPDNVTERSVSTFQTKTGEFREVSIIIKQKGDKT